MTEFLVYTDGASSKDGRGGWAWVLLVGDTRIAYRSGGAYNTTNQRMELQAVISALEHLPPDKAALVVSDSAYVVNCFLQGWREKWEKRSWENAKGRAVMNADLWRRLFELTDQLGERIAFKHVKGHNGDRWNTYVDDMAVRAKPTATKGLL